jgi:hypothetical protein
MTKLVGGHVSHRMKQYPSIFLLHSTQTPSGFCILDRTPGIRNMHTARKLAQPRIRDNFASSATSPLAWSEERTCANRSKLRRPAVRYSPCTDTNSPREVESEVANALLLFVSFLNAPLAPWYVLYGCVRTSTASCLSRKCGVQPCKSPGPWKKSLQHTGRGRDGAEGRHP